MWELEEKVALLEENKPCEQLRALLAKRSLSEAIQETQKQARNLGEDLLEDQLGLDNVTGLSEPERASRKKALAIIDKFLDDVDRAKSKLAELAKACVCSNQLVPFSNEAVSKKVKERGRPAKTPKRKVIELDREVSKKCRKLAGALNKAADLPSDVSKMLVDVVPLCLDLPQDQRHRFQAHVVEAVDRMMQSVEETMKKNIADMQSKYNEAKQQASPYEAKVVEAEEKLRAAVEDFHTETKILADTALKFRAARKRLEEEQSIQKSGDQDYEAAAQEKEKLQTIVDDYIVPLKTGTVPESEVKKHCESLLATLPQLDASFDEAILLVLRSSLTKAPSSRGPFEKMAIDQLVDTMTKQIELENQTLVSGETGKQQRASMVHKAQQEFDEALNKQKVRAEAFQMSLSLKNESESALAMSHESLKTLASNIKDHEKTLHKAEADLETFLNGARNSFEELKVRFVASISAAA